MSNSSCALFTRQSFPRAHFIRTGTWRTVSVLWCCFALVSCKVDIPNAPVPTKQLWVVWEKDFPSTRLSLSPDGRILVAYRADQSVAPPQGVGRYRAFNASTGDQMQLPIPDTANELKFSPDGKHCAAQMGERIDIYDLQSGEVVRSISEWGHEDPVITYAWTDNETLATIFDGLLTFNLRLRNVTNSSRDEYIPIEDAFDYLSDGLIHFRVLRDGYLQVNSTLIIDLINETFIRGPQQDWRETWPNVDATTWFEVRETALVLVNQSRQVQWTIPIALDQNGDILSRSNSNLIVHTPRVSASGRYATVTGFFYPNEFSPYLFVLDTHTGEHLVHIPLGPVMQDLNKLDSHFDVVFAAEDERTLFTILDGHISRWRIE